MLCKKIVCGPYAIWGEAPNITIFITGWIVLVWKVFLIIPWRRMLLMNRQRRWKWSKLFSSIYLFIYVYTFLSICYIYIYICVTICIVMYIYLSRSCVSDAAKDTSLPSNIAGIPVVSDKAFKRKYIKLGNAMLLILSWILKNNANAMPQPVMWPLLILASLTAIF